MSGIIKTDKTAEQLWPGLRAAFKKQYDDIPTDWTDAFRYSPQNCSRPAGWQRFAAPFRESGWRIRVAIDVLCRGDASTYLDDY